MARVLVALLLAAQAASGSMTILSSDAMSRVERPREAVARTAAEWETLWRDHAGAAPRPAVDLSTHMVVAVFLGSRMTGGVSVEIVGTRTATDGLVVEWTEHKPGRGQVAPPIITSPAQIVALPRVAGAVRFERVEP